ncbi:hypothetical protein GCM10023314_16090 [Algibacter agarivorans]|uniref:WYL domain-containing protein n=1 Tax=Algibacter agarivorans TaxID=1109741 RepID=A0ABP9GHV5_9FLAO
MNEKKNIKTICEAISKHKLIQFKYKGLPKVVEPYLIGEHEDNGNIVLRAFSVGGKSKSTNVLGWKFYDLTHIVELTIRIEDIKIKKDYNPNDRDISRIICRI